MKKVLLGTSAIALAGAAAGPASAAEWDVKVGGYALSYLAYTGVDLTNQATPAAQAADFDGVDVFWDGEVHFKPSITLDNGIKIGADIQLEARASAPGAIASAAPVTALGAVGVAAPGLVNPGTGDIIDEAYVYIQGSFGEILMGDENSAGYKMHYGAPNFSGIGVNSPQSTFVPVSSASTGADLFRGTLSSTYIENSRNNDAGRITYFTPRFAGFQVGVSYARDASQNTASQQNINLARASNIIDVGANYVNSFGGVDVAASARWGTATDDRVAVAGTEIGTDPTVLGFGARIGVAGFSIGGSWAEQNGDGNRDGTAWEAGVAYQTGPWGFSFNYLHGENVDNEAVTGGGAQTAPVAALGRGNDETLDHYQLGVQYSLAKGVNLNLAGGYVDFDEDVGVGVVPGATSGNDVDGFYIATGVRINF